MASQIFHLFPSLPKELRDMIWALSIRPQRPSAHFFTVFNSEKDDEWSAMAQYAMSHGMIDRCALAAPRRNLDAPNPSWTDGNLSAYLIDGGLCTACKESRQAAERHFQTLYWMKKLKRPVMVVGHDRINLPNAPAPGTFMSGTERWRCMTYPKSDLFCLQPLNPKTLDWEDLDLRIPIFDSSEGFYPNHIALEYDPKWEMANPDDGTWRASRCAIKAATDRLYWAKNLWFIDYNIRRRSGQVAAAEDKRDKARHQFYGNGCRFTEVQYGDLGWDMEPSVDIFGFLDFLYIEVQEQVRRGNESPGLEGPRCYWGEPTVGVLACEVGNF